MTYGSPDALHDVRMSIAGDKLRNPAYKPTPQPASLDHVSTPIRLAPTDNRELQFSVLD